MTVVKSWLHFMPLGDIPDELNLVGQRQDVHVGSHVDMQYVELVWLAQIVRNIDEAGGSRLWYAIVQHHQLLLEVKIISGRTVGIRDQ